MSRKKRRTFSNDYMADAVRLYRESGESLRSVAEKLGILESSLRRWVKQADIDAGKGPEGALTTTEKEDVRQMKREIKRLREENEFLKKAAAYFAKTQENSK